MGSCLWVSAEAPVMVARAELSRGTTEHAQVKAFRDIASETAGSSAARLIRPQHSRRARRRAAGAAGHDLFTSATWRKISKTPGCRG